MQNDFIKCNQMKFHLIIKAMIYDTCNMLWISWVTRWKTRTKLDGVACVLLLENKDNALSNIIDKYLSLKRNHVHTYMHKSTVFLRQQQQYIHVHIFIKLCKKNVSSIIKYRIKFLLAYNAAACIFIQSGDMLCNQLKSCL